MGESLQFGEEEDNNDEVDFEGDADAAVAEDLPIEASNDGAASEGEAGSHSDFGIEEVRFNTSAVIHSPLYFLSTVLTPCSLRSRGTTMCDPKVPDPTSSADHRYTRLNRRTIEQCWCLLLACVYTIPSPFPDF